MLMHSYLQITSVNDKKKTGSFSLIERVILSAGAMLIFSVSFQIDQMPEGTCILLTLNYIGSNHGVPLSRLARLSS
jgi:hypothetical protein